MIEREIAVRSGTASLAGSLAVPDGPPSASCVLMIAGTGPLDRDENMPGQRLDIFNTLARDFAARGIASFRYDKRGCGKSTGDYFPAGHFDLVADAGACLAFLRSGKAGTFTRLYLVGHSEGTIIAAQLAASQRVDGLVLLSPFIQRTEAILMAQAARLEEILPRIPGLAGRVARLVARFGRSPTEQQRRLIARLKSTSAPVLRSGGSRIPARALREMLSLDPPRIYANVEAPALVLAGAKDLQCDPADAALIAAAIGRGATALVLPDLTHLLRTDKGSHDFLSYGDLAGKPMDAGVVRVVGDWLAARERLAATDPEAAFRR